MPWVAIARQSSHLITGDDLDGDASLKLFADLFSGRTLTVTGE